MDQVLISTLIILYCIWIFGADGPNVTLKKFCAAKLTRLFHLIGLGHNWMMFAPNPLKTNRDSSIVLIRDKEEIVLWSSPCLAMLKGLDKAVSIRERKWSHNLCLPTQVNARYSFIEYHIRKAESMGFRKFRIKLLTHETLIPDFKTRAETLANTYVLAEYDVDLDSEVLDAPPPPPPAHIS